MGLIKNDGYKVKGIELPVAYAKINRLYIERGNLARTYFGISSSRENINDGNSLIELEFPCYVDKNEPIYEQVYVLAKENLFQGWEDDIVVDEPVEEEPTPEIDDMMLEDMPQVSIVPNETDETENDKNNKTSTMPLEEKIMEKPDDKYFETKEEIVEPTMPEQGVW